MHHVIRASVVVAAAVVLGGCFATGAKHRPIVDGSDPRKYEADLAACQEVARQRSYLNPDVQMQAAIGGAVGAVVDGVEGAVAGAAIGGGPAPVDTVPQPNAKHINSKEGPRHTLVEYQSH
ncbi:MAG: glycine zipper family protein, partial [Gammaproteobacteria bacterium]|nr:glycine zipper family protein [Gammaproteobacteria bacterium]